MAIHVIGMPINQGCDKYGANLGPDKYREMNLISNLKELGYDVMDMGNIEITETQEEDKFRYHEKLKYYDIIVDANTKLAFKVYESISRGNFPLILGGDHSLGIGSIAGISKHIKKLGVVWVDAHGDLNTEETTFTGNIHGMPLAASMGKGPDKLTNLFEHRVKIQDDNIVHIAGRDLDPGETKLIENSKIKAFSMNAIKELGIDKVIEESIKYLKDKVDAIHMSFDIDSIDSLLVPGTGTRVKDGITVEDARKILVAFASSGMLVSMDFVELNPALDKDNITAQISTELLQDVFKNLNAHSEQELKLG